jgi:molecular chaperone GrpE
MEEKEEKGLEQVRGEEPQAENAAAAEEGEGASVDQALQEELSRLQEELSRFREMYLRKLADFENFRKRKEKEMQEFRRSAHADLLRDVLPVLDNLERALAVPEGDGSGIRTGVELVLRQLKEVLARYGLQEVNPTGEAFDPRYHEALARQEREGLAGETVLEVLQKGYMLQDKLLRPALVVVGVPKGEKEGEPPVSPAGGAREGGEGGGEPWVS